MKMKEILEKESTQLRNELAEQQKHMFELRSQAVTEKLEDPSQLGKTKKVIARIMTVLRQRELAGQDTNGAKTGGEAGGEGEAAETGTKTRKPAARRTRKPAARGGKKTAAKKPAAKKKTATKAGTKSRPATRKPAAKKAARKAKAAAK